jgi:hypothetical protein
LNIQSQGKPLSQNQIKIKIHNQNIKFQLNVSLSAIKTKSNNSNRQSDIQIAKSIKNFTCFLVNIEVESVDADLQALHGEIGLRCGDRRCEDQGPSLNEFDEDTG